MLNRNMALHEVYLPGTALGYSDTGVTAARLVKYVASLNDSLIKRVPRGRAEREGCGVLSSTRFPLANNRIT